MGSRVDPIYRGVYANEPDLYFDIIAFGFYGVAVISSGDLELAFAADGWEEKK